MVARFHNARTCNRTCQHCGKPFQARVADVKRGWANFCTKSCSAQYREGGAQVTIVRKAKLATTPKPDHDILDESFEEWDRIAAREDGVPYTPIRRPNRGSQNKRDDK